MLPAPPAPPPSASAQDPPILLLRADGVIGPDCVLIPDGVVLVRGDRILAVGQKVATPSSARVIQLEGVLAPGFVDAFTRLGAEGGISEASSWSTPRLRAVDALDPDAEVWRERLAHGVTAAQLVPAVRDPDGDPIRVLAGTAGVVASGGRDRLLLAVGRSTVGLISGPFTSREGGPGSLAGAAEALGRSLAADPGVVGAKALVVVDSAEGVRAGRAALADRDLAWLGRGDPAAYGGLLRGELLGLPAIDDGNWTPRRIETWRRLHAAGVRIAFGTGAGGSWNGPGALRASAMAFARATGDAAAALAAITRNAADLAGLGRGYGRLAPGARADLVLWSGHPLDAAARVRSVMIAGRTVWSAAPVAREEEE
ncbi:MAG: hypothetical protein D6702_11570 [Planctomycetota bacterium]|nr:MAG: hypothetical protein D6702_11570 [Planctomycetota bacterium]